MVDLTNLYELLKKASEIIKHESGCEGNYDELVEELELIASKLKNHILVEEK